MSLLDTPQVDEPIEVGPEPPPEPSESMKKVMNLSRAVHLQCCIERARRLVDDAALYAATSRVYGDEMQADFDHSGDELRRMRSELGELGGALKKVVNDLGKELSASTKSDGKELFGEARISFPSRKTL